ncbi:site-specific integrase [Rhodococcoides fascians]|uniref:tyrosine-type recombinase/integrase n=1 Tax=Rhodococcoides fascians TaxID=1828 RepID=UPI000B9BFB42|nr:site-specific integrase [Rhodococcus fascians]OZE84161.1 site-specific integrase [Rhodococcus fascians]OZF11048.1 site-specific integrase [Rhodococcus fascians]OZF14807.1 site-specific integrase [Rhodococcus fascians]OZF61386.1 site-specific integrase [Rhodococcus fascians]OZF63057.1 site-specific integrase [Rhodococcus fascians]
MANKRRQWGQIKTLTPSGRYRATYQAPDGQKYAAPHTFAARIDAEAWLTDRRREIDRDRWSPPSEDDGKTVTFGEYAGEWMAHHSSLKPKTRHEYQNYLDNFILPTFKDQRVATIKPAAVRRWHSTTLVDRATYRTRVYQLLKTIFNQAVKDELIVGNPCTIDGAATVRRKHRIRPATAEELAVIREAMPDQYRLMIALSAWCALRFGEVTELRRKDIDTVDETIRVRRGVVYIPKEGFIVGTPKSEAGMRDVPIPPHLMPEVNAHLREHVAQGAQSLLFPRKTDPTVHLAQGAFARDFDKARAAANRPDLTFHDLRHTGATWAAQVGATTAELMERLGHSSPGAAQRYQHVARGRGKEVARRLSALQLLPTSVSDEIDTP